MVYYSFYLFLLFLYLRYSSINRTFKKADSTTGIASTHKFLIISMPRY